MGLLKWLFGASKPPEEHVKAFRRVRRCPAGHFSEGATKVCPSCGTAKLEEVTARPVVRYWDDDPMGAGYWEYDIVRWELSNEKS